MMNEKKLVHYLTNGKRRWGVVLLRKKFTGSKRVLPAVKIIKLRKSEEGFNRKLLHQYRVQKNNTLPSYNPIPCILL
jgi:hypothetical protein